jgi:cell division protein DivIC
LFKQNKEPNGYFSAIMKKRVQGMKKKGIFVSNCFYHETNRKYMKEKVKILTSMRILGLTVTQILILMVLIVVLFIFSDSSVIKRYRYESQIKELKSQIEYYREQTNVDRKKLRELQSNNEDLEKFARENYFMKKENEDVFIID